MKQEHDEALSKYKALLEAEKGLQKQIAELQDNIQNTRLELDKVGDKYKNEVELVRQTLQSMLKSWTI